MNVTRGCQWKGRIMLNSFLLWAFAPGAYFWFDRGDDPSIGKTVERWDRSFHLHDDTDPGSTSETKLYDRYLSAFGLCGAIFAYGLPAVLFVAIGGLIATIGSDQSRPLADTCFTIGLIWISYLIGLSIPVVIKTMALQLEARRFSRLRHSERALYEPAKWSIPSNIDLLLALPGFFLFASIWWGR